MEKERKIERKRRRFAARLQNINGIVCTETAGPNIVICNAGRSTGFEKDSLINLCNEISLEVHPPKFITVKGESHCFLVFRNTENAVSFYNACHGKAKADKNGTPMYLNFVEDVPSTEIICSHGDPKGLTLLNNFISKNEEKQFIELFDWTEDACSLKNRRVKHYGYEFRYGTNDVDLEKPLTEKIPVRCDVLWKRLDEQGFNLGRPDQLTVNKYSPGHGIPSHVDKHSPFCDTILSLSLGSSVVMDWKHHSGINVPVLLPARSLLIMQGEARYDWQHGIQQSFTDPIIEYHTDEKSQKTVKIITEETRQRETRISLTFRWTRSGPCECGYKVLCDSKRTENLTELDDHVASHLEELHVHQVYEQIAGHFSSTRHTPWPRVVQFVRDVTPATVLLDLGAGNGKNVLRRNDILQIAGERSSGLVAECSAHTRHVPAADCVRLDILNAGIKDSCADVAICIAVIHHMSTKARRLQAISTIHRLLRSSGRALITVWAKDQSKSNYLSKTKIATENAQVNVNGVNLHVHENRTQFQHKDLLVPWKLKTKSVSVPKSDNTSKVYNNSSKVDNNSSKRDNNSSKCDNNSSKNGNKPPKRDKLVETDSTLLRFYHVFEEGELDELCREVGFDVESSFYEEGNWCVICNKV